MKEFKITHVSPFADEGQAQDRTGEVKAICRFENGILASVEGETAYAKDLRGWMGNEEISEHRFLMSLSSMFDGVEVVVDEPQTDHEGTLNL